MDFEQNKAVEKLGERVGYVFAYFLFTTILFFILSFLDKIPYSWSYFHVMGLTFLIAVFGYIVQRFLR